MEMDGDESDDSSPTPQPPPQYLARMGSQSSLPSFRPPPGRQGPGGQPSKAMSVKPIAGPPLPSSHHFAAFAKNPVPGPGGTGTGGTGTGGNGAANTVLSGSNPYGSNAYAYHQAGADPPTIKKAVLSTRGGKARAAAAAPRWESVSGNPFVNPSSNAGAYYGGGQGGGNSSSSSNLAVGGNNRRHSVPGADEPGPDGADDEPMQLPKVVGRVTSGPKAAAQAAARTSEVRKLLAAYRPNQKI